MLTRAFTSAVFQALIFGTLLAHFRGPMNTTNSSFLIAENEDDSSIHAPAEPLPLPLPPAASHSPANGTAAAASSEVLALFPRPIAEICATVSGFVAKEFDRAFNGTFLSFTLLFCEYVAVPFLLCALKIDVLWLPRKIWRFCWRRKQPVAEVEEEHNDEPATAEQTAHFEAEIERLTAGLAAAERERRAEREQLVAEMARRAETAEAENAKLLASKREEESRLRAEMGVLSAELAAAKASESRLRAEIESATAAAQREGDRPAETAKAKIERLNAELATANASAASFKEEAARKAEQLVEAQQHLAEETRRADDAEARLAQLTASKLEGTEGAEKLRVELQTWSAKGRVLESELANINAELAAARAAESHLRTEQEQLLAEKAKAEHRIAEETHRADAAEAEAKKLTNKQPSARPFNIEIGSAALGELVQALHPKMSELQKEIAGWALDGTKPSSSPMLAPAQQLVTEMPEETKQHAFATATALLEEAELQRMTVAWQFRRVSSKARAVSAQLSFKCSIPKECVFQLQLQGIKDLAKLAGPHAEGLAISAALLQAIVVDLDMVKTVNAASIHNFVVALSRHMSDVLHRNLHTKKQLDVLFQMLMLGTKSQERIAIETQTEIDPIACGHVLASLNVLATKNEDLVSNTTTLLELIAACTEALGMAKFELSGEAPALAPLDEFCNGSGFERTDVSALGRLATDASNKYYAAVEFFEDNLDAFLHAVEDHLFAALGDGCCDEAFTLRGFPKMLLGVDPEPLPSQDDMQLRYSFLFSTMERAEVAEICRDYARAEVGAALEEEAAAVDSASVMTAKTQRLAESCTLLRSALKKLVRPLFLQNVTPPLSDDFVERLQHPSMSIERAVAAVVEDLEPFFVVVKQTMKEEAEVTDAMVETLLESLDSEVARRRKFASRNPFDVPLSEGDPLWLLGKEALGHQFAFINGVAKVFELLWTILADTGLGWKAYVENKRVLDLHRVVIAGQATGNELLQAIPPALRELRVSCDLFCTQGLDSFFADILEHTRTRFLRA